MARLMELLKLSLSARRAWIEITYVTRLPRAQVSLSARRAWIEICRTYNAYQQAVVALRKESVDRNLYWGLSKEKPPPVALRKESVDRNIWIDKTQSPPSVALRKESVDRNPKNPMIRINEIPSLSARRAWIEIIEEVSKYVVKDVALRKESVDRNSWWLLA